MTGEKRYGISKLNDYFYEVDEDEDKHSEEQEDSGLD